jgi:3-oxocholest-4-en-26-oate---CoA ligase
VVDEEELVDHCRGELAPFKVPRRIVTVDQVQRRPSGKLDLRWARELAVS